MMRYIEAYPAYLAPAGFVGLLNGQCYLRLFDSAAIKQSDIYRLRLVPILR